MNNESMYDDAPNAVTIRKKPAPPKISTATLFVNKEHAQRLRDSCYEQFGYQHASTLAALDKYIETGVRPNGNR